VVELGFVDVERGRAVDRRLVAARRIEVEGATYREEERDWRRMRRGCLEEDKEGVTERRRRRTLATKQRVGRRKTSWGRMIGGS
jgi:hypothetical protein